MDAYLYLFRSLNQRYNGFGKRSKVMRTCTNPYIVSILCFGKESTDTWERVPILNRLRTFGKKVKARERVQILTSPEYFALGKRVRTREHVEILTSSQYFA